MTMSLFFSNLDTTDLNSPLVFWPMIESSLGIVSACLPMLRPLFTPKSTSGTLVANEIANN